MAAVPASPCHSGAPASVTSASGRPLSASATATCAAAIACKRLLAALREDRQQRRVGRLQPHDEIFRRAPVVRPQPTDGAMAAASAGDRFFGASQRFGDAVDAAAEIDVAERRDFQRARTAAHGEGVEPEARQRMLQQRHDGGGRKVFGRRGDDEIEEGPRRRLGERAAGGIVDADAPGFEAHGDAARQQPVGRYQRGGTAGRLGRLAQDESDGFRLVLRRRCLDQADAGKRAAHRSGVGRLDVVQPATRHAGRAHCFGDDRLAAGAIRIERARRGEAARCCARRRARRAAWRNRIADARDAR